MLFFLFVLIHQFRPLLLEIFHTLIPHNIILSMMTEAQRYELGAYVNLMLSSTQLLINPIKGLMPKFSMENFEEFMSWKDRKAKKSTCEEYKDFIVSLANLLYKIDLDDRDQKLLWKSLRKNKKMLKSMDISKKEFDIDIMNATIDALKYKYKNAAEETV